MDGREPVQQRELAPVHHGIGSEALPVVALFALEDNERDSWIGFFSLFL